jgi:DNA topoisomerase-2
MDDSMMDDDIFEISDGGSSDFVPEPASVRIGSSRTSKRCVANHIVKQKPKAKAAPKKAASAPKAAPKKMTQTTLKPKAKTAPAKKKAKADSEDEMSDANMSDVDDDSLLSHTPPKAKKAAAPKRAGSKPLADVSNESFGGEAASEAPGKNGSASEKYQKVSRLTEPAHPRRFALTPVIHSLHNLNTSLNVLIPTSAP